MGRGGGGGQGPPNQKIGLTSITFFLAPPGVSGIYFGASGWIKYNILLLAASPDESLNRYLEQ